MIRWVDEIDWDAEDWMDQVVRRETVFSPMLDGEVVVVVASGLGAIVTPRFAVDAAVTNLRERHGACEIEVLDAVAHERLSVYDREEYAIMKAEYPIRHRMEECQ